MRVVPAATFPRSCIRYFTYFTYIYIVCIYVVYVRSNLCARTARTRKHERGRSRNEQNARRRRPVHAIPSREQFKNTRAPAPIRRPPGGARVHSPRASRIIIIPNAERTHTRGSFGSLLALYNIRETHASGIIHATLLWPRRRRRHQYSSEIVSTTRQRRRFTNLI